MDNKERLSKRIWWAKANLERGKNLAEQRDDNSLCFFDLDREDQDLVAKYDSEKLRSLQYTAVRMLRLSLEVTATMLK